MRRTRTHRILQPRTTPDRALRSTFATNMALAVIGAATGIISARLLHPSGEGELTAIQTWPLLLGALAMLGLDSALVYFIPSQPDSGRQLTSTAVLIGLVSAIGVGAAAWLALPLLLSAQQQQVISAARVYMLIGCNYALIGLPQGSLRGARSFTVWNLVRLSPGITWLFVLLAAWQLGHANAVTLSRWNLAMSFFCGVPFLIVVARRLQGPLRPDPRLAPKLLRFGLPTALISLPQTVNLRFDQLLIVAFLPARSLGLYAVAVAWSGAISPGLSAVGSVLFPHMSAAKDDAGRQGHLLATALQSGALVAAAATGVLMLLAPVAMPLIFGRGFDPSVPSALLLVPAGAILAWSGIAEQGLLGLGHPTTVFVAEAAGAVVTLAALPVLLHTSGIFGAAVASLLGYSTVAVFAAVVISRSTRQRVWTLVVPTWPVTVSLLTRGAGLLRLRRHRPGRHRLPTMSSSGGQAL